MKKNRAIFCADDWGMSPGINEGILELGRRGLLNSVSCLANSDYLSYGLTELLEFHKKGLKLNIHFNLTYKRPVNLENKSLQVFFKKNEMGSFLFFCLKSLLFLIRPSEIKDEFVSQMKTLLDLGIPITGLDGHHHVHLLPNVFFSIRGALEKEGIKEIRYVKDLSHLGSYLLGLQFEIAFKNRNKSLICTKCGYLVSKDLKNSSSTKNKIDNFKHLIVHPAKYDDFELSGMTDSLRTERVQELQSLLEYFDE